MALDKLVDSTQLDGAMTATANALRAKGGTSASIAWDATNGFKAAVEALPSGGGGGLVYETGTWTLASNTTSAVLNFQEQHSEPPFFYMIYYSNTDDFMDTASAIGITYSNIGRVFGEIIYGTSKTNIHGYATQRYSGNTTPSSGGGSVLTSVITTPYDDESSTLTSDSQFWATKTGIKAYCNNRTFHANTTYKWIAVWAPTT